MLFELFFLIICQGILGDSEKPFYDTKDFEAMNRHFENFLQEHNKEYDEEEKNQRFNIFIENVNKINEFNKLFENTTFESDSNPTPILFATIMYASVQPGRTCVKSLHIPGNDVKVSFKLSPDNYFILSVVAFFKDINKFSDWTEEESNALLGFKIPHGANPIGDCKVLGDPTTKDAPAAFDWRDHGLVSPVKAQQSCGSCWAFSTAGLMESRYLQKKKTVFLSEQQLVDCDTQSTGCQGGFMSSALTYLMKAGGQETESDYPYQNKQGTCHFDKSKVAAKVVSCTAYKLTSEEALKELLYKEGPLAIVGSSKSWLQYTKGVWSYCSDTALNHAVLLVGYGSEKGVDYWIIKNSWGSTYGENGYIRLKRGVKCDGIGGIGQNAPHAVVSAVVA